MTAPRVILAPGDDAARAAVAHTVCPRPTLLHDVVRLCLERFLDAVAEEAPAPPGPRLYLANHQTGFDLLFLAVTLAGLEGMRSRIVAWEWLRYMHYGEMLVPLFERPDAGAFEPWVELVLIDPRQPEATGAAIGALSARGDRASVIAAAEGGLQVSEDQPVRRVGTALLDLAQSAEMPIVPVRIAWGLPVRTQGARQCWPHALAPLRLCLGAPLAPETLAPLPLPERRRRVCEAIDALRPPRPPDHNARNAAMARRVGSIMALTGVTQTKAVLQDLFLAADPKGLTEEGREVREFLLRGQHAPLARRDGWLYRYALTLSDGMITTDLPFATLYGGAAGSAGRSAGAEP